MSERVSPGSHLTLHYRITLADPPHTEVLTTFGGAPATLVLGSGELSPALEALLVGLACGEPHDFTIPAGEVFGPRRHELVQQVPMADFPPTMKVELGQVIEFTSAGGERFTGLVEALDAQGASVDFNHPLAGRAVRFQVEILAAL